jgi:hypothetical protein
MFTTQPSVFGVNKPEVISFSASQTEVDLTDSNLRIDFEVIVSHPAGISDSNTNLTLTNSGTNSISVLLTRTDTPINLVNSKVTFRGNLNIPRNFLPGVYNYSIDGVTSNLESGLKISTGLISGPKLRNLKGAETGILVRLNGELSLDYPTINGPTYGSQNGKSYIDVKKYLSVEEPIWKVGEIFDPVNYFESAVEGLLLNIKTSTPSICASDGRLLRFKSIGDCSFSVSTDVNKDYITKTIFQSQAIAGPRQKQELNIESVPKLTNKKLPFSLTLAPVYASGTNNVEYVIPKSITPMICDVNVYVLSIISDGKCILSYQSKGNIMFLPSEVYKQEIEIEKQLQSMIFTLPIQVELSSKTLALSATASSGGAVTYATASTGICSITGSTLNLLMRGSCAITATQVGTTTLAPISATATVMIAGAAAPSRKTITCVKGNKSKKVSGTNPKCPTGYKLKR